MDSSISSDDVQWYRLIMDTITAVMVDPQDSNIHFATCTINNTLTSSLTIPLAAVYHPQSKELVPQGYNPI